jgi:hypothetical protein
MHAEANEFTIKLVAKIKIDNMIDFILSSLCSAEWRLVRIPAPFTYDGALT